jgi:hypothetical protein
MSGGRSKVQWQKNSPTARINQIVYLHIKNQCAIKLASNGQFGLQVKKFSPLSAAEGVLILEELLKARQLSYVPLALDTERI